MGNTAYTSSYPVTILDEGSNLVLNGTDRFDFNFILEDENQDHGGSTDKLQLEDNDSGGAKSFLINEETLPDEIAQNIANLNSESKILLNGFRENPTAPSFNSSSYLVLNATD